MTTTKCWLVWCPARGMPRQRHSSLVSAACEAERLARANPDQTFFVMESVLAYRVNGLQVIDMREES